MYSTGNSLFDLLVFVLVLVLIVWLIVTVVRRL